MEHKQVCETMIVLVVIILGIAVYQMIIPLLIGGFMLYAVTWPMRMTYQLNKAVRKYNSRN